MIRKYAEWVDVAPWGREVSVFAGDFGKLAAEDIDQAKAVSDLLFSMLDDEDWGKVACMAFRERMECKVAADAPKSGWGTMAGHAKNVIGGVAITTMTAMLLDHLARRRARSAQLSRDIDKLRWEISQRNPNLAKDPNFQEYFDLIIDFAPSLIAHPLAVTNLLQQLHDLGPAAVTPSLIQNLVDVERTKQEQNEQGHAGLLSMASPLSRLVN